jgi:hypothetical protein
MTWVDSKGKGNDRPTEAIVQELRQGLFLPIQQEAADRLVELEKELHYLRHRMERDRSGHDGFVDNPGWSEAAETQPR